MEDLVTLNNMIQSNVLSHFKGKKVFITGHTGFKGSWLVKWLHLIGAEIRGYSLPPEGEKNLYTELGIDRDIDSILQDIRNNEMLDNAVLSFQPDYIFHLAAQPLVRESYKDPLYTYETNVIGTANLLASIKRLDKKCSTVIITTDKVYENNEWNYPYRESDRLGGHDPYSSSKACTEIVVQSFRDSFFNKSGINDHLKGIASARAGNVIGGGDWAADRLIPDIIRSYSKNEETIVRNPNSIRPWQHVIEPLYGYLLLASKLDDDAVKYSTAWNFGPFTNDNLTVKQVVEKSLKVLGKGGYSIFSQEDDFHEAGLLKLDINKTMSELGWSPRLSSNQTIEMTITWYKEFLEGKDPNELVESNINLFLD